MGIGSPGVGAASPGASAPSPSGSNSTSFGGLAITSQSGLATESMPTAATSFRSAANHGPSPLATSPPFIDANKEHISSETKAASSGAPKIKLTLKRS